MHFKRLSFMVCELYLYKAISRKYTHKEAF